MNDLVALIEKEAKDSLLDISVYGQEVTLETVENWYLETEKIIRVIANLALDKSSHQAINQLRYAGHHLVKASTTKNKTEKQDNIVEAYKHCKRAYYDMLDFYVLMLLDKFESTLFDSTQEATSKLHDDIKANILSIQNARFENKTRLEYYQLIRGGLIEGLDLLDQCNQLSTSKKYSMLQKENAALVDKETSIDNKIKKRANFQIIVVLTIATTTLLGLLFQGSLTNYFFDSPAKHEVEHHITPLIKK